MIVIVFSSKKVYAFNAIQKYLANHAQEIHISADFAFSNEIETFEGCQPINWSTLLFNFSINH